MGLLAMVGTILVVTGYFLFLFAPVTKVARDNAAADVLATAMLVYQKAAIDWCLRTTCPDGIIPPAALVLPPGYRQAAWLTATAQGGRVSTMITGSTVSALGIANRLGDLTQGGPAAGLAVLGPSGTVSVAARDFVPGQRVPVTANSAVLSGDAVASQQVR